MKIEGAIKLECYRLEVFNGESVVNFFRIHRDWYEEIQTGQYEKVIDDEIIVELETAYSTYFKTVTVLPDDSKTDKFPGVDYTVAERVIDEYTNRDKTRMAHFRSWLVDKKQSRSTVGGR